MLDEDDTVKDLAVKTAEELWFQISLFSSSRSKGSAPANNQDDKGSLLMKVAVIMGTSAHFKDHHSPLENVLHKVIADKEGIEADAIRAQYVEICETLIDGLVDASDLPGFVCVFYSLSTSLFKATHRRLLTAFGLYICSHRPTLPSCQVPTLRRYCRTSRVQLR
jgi:cohesin loading factor subunit SCC2